MLSANKTSLTVLKSLQVTALRFPPVLLGCRHMTSFTGLAPLVPNTGVTCTAVNYGGRLQIGITADLVSMPELDGLGAKLHAAFDALLAAASDKTSSATTQ